MGGRIGLLEDWTTEDGLLRIEGWAREGLTEKQIAEQKIGVSERTFTNWKQRSSAIVSALKKGKAPVDTQVENALLKRALGYQSKETQIRREIIGFNTDPLTGVATPIFGSHSYAVEVTKQVPPDTTAIIYWLKNRKPEQWRDRREVETIIPEDDPLNEVLKRWNDAANSESEAT